MALPLQLFLSVILNFIIKNILHVGSNKHHTSYAFNEIKVSNNGILRKSESLSDLSESSLFRAKFDHRFNEFVLFDNVKTEGDLFIVLDSPVKPRIELS